ncbi:hypothetical protein [Flavobacterium subsaxonicum]|nr:hypothetical protein [Flavobacterium subsaxonicum]
MKKSIICMFVAVMVLTSCSSDDDNGSVSGSRDITYEITGNYSGDLDVTYITASGGATSAEVTSLPWELSFTAEEGSSGASFNAGGFEGQPGETISLKIYQGDDLKNTVNATADSDGIIVAVSGTVIIQ